MSSRATRMQSVCFYDKKINILPVLFSTTVWLTICHVSMAFTNLNGYNMYSKMDQQQMLSEESVKAIVKRQQHQDQHQHHHQHRQHQQHQQQQHQPQQQYSKDHPNIKEIITRLKKVKCSINCLENKSNLQMDTSMSSPSSSFISTDAFKRWPSLRNLLKTTDYIPNSDINDYTPPESNSESVLQHPWPILKPMYNRLMDRLQRVTQNGAISIQKDVLNKDSINIDAVQDVSMNPTNQLEIRERFQRKNKKSLSQYMAPCHFKICNMGRKRGISLP